MSDRDDFFLFKSQRRQESRFTLRTFDSELLANGRVTVMPAISGSAARINHLSRIRKPGRAAERIGCASIFQRLSRPLIKFRTVVRGESVREAGLYIPAVLTCGVHTPGSSEAKLEEEPARRGAEDRARNFYLSRGNE